MWTPLSNLINTKKDNFLNNEFENAQIPTVWKEALEEIFPEATEYVKYKNLKDNTLYIKALDSIWIQEINNRQEELKEYINKKRKTPVYNINISL